VKVIFGNQRDSWVLWSQSLNCWYSLVLQNLRITVTRPLRSMVNTSLCQVRLTCDENDEAMSLLVHVMIGLYIELSSLLRYSNYLNKRLRR